ncbi:MAG: patatin-like phospholipase family protein [Bacteroidales bacterium]|nr:patatin-like phospholipase family protein [Bacteroidales bacterium]
MTFNYKSLLIVILSLLLLSGGLTRAQQRLCYGIDPRLDSIAFAQFGQRMDSIRQQRPTVALVLSGGGAKGAAHIPVIEYLDSIGMPVDLVMGTSIGGLLGGLYAVGYSGKELEKMMRSQDWNNLMLDSHPRRYDALAQKDYDRRFQFNGAFGRRTWDIRGLDRHHTNLRRGLLTDGIVQGRNIEDLFASLLVGVCDSSDFLNFPTPFVCVATDMVSAQPKLWHSGSLITALRSTMAIPGIFTAVKQDGMVLLDGSMRSNMPSEIAHMLGADIIIAVDISSPALKATQINSLVDIVYQATDIMGREAYMESIKASSIYIKPDVSDYSLLSFDSTSISALIQRGKEAVAKEAELLDSLAQSLGRTQRTHSRVSDISMTPVVIDSVVFDNLNDKEARNVRKMLDIKNVVMRYHLDDAVSTMMGTRTFEKVTYSLSGDTTPYTLHFRCHPSAINEIGGSARFDAIEFASLLLHIGLGAHRLTGSRYDLTVRLGLNTSAEVAYTYRSGHAIDFGASLSFQALRHRGWNDSKNIYSIDFNRSRLDAFMALIPFKQVRLHAGVRLDYFYQISMLANHNDLATTFKDMPKSDIWPVVYSRLRTDDYDDAYFPTRGHSSRLFYGWSPGGLQGKGTSFHIWHANFDVAFTKDNTTFMPFVEGRYISATVIPYINMLSVSNANKCLDQQITFMGITTAYAAERSLLTIGMNNRVPLARRHFLTVGIQALLQSDDFKELFYNSTTNMGFCIEYAYNSILGPLRFNVHWSDLSKKIGFYLGFGLDF